MAFDKIIVPPDVPGGNEVNTDKIAGKHTPIHKIAFGAEGTVTPVESANPLPVEIQGSLGTADTRSLGSSLVTGDVGLVTNTVIHGQSTAGGGSYVDVKVNPSGALVADVSDSIVTLDAATITALQIVDVNSSVLPTGAATETTLGSINTKLPTAIVDMPSMNVASIPVRQAPQKYWDWSFANVQTNTVDSDRATVIRTGTGQTVNQTGGNLVITAGTTANAETVIRTLETWSGALTVWAAVTLSQRIANNNFFIELVDVIGDGLAYNIVNATTVDVTKVAHGFTAINVGQRMDLCAITGAAGIPMEGVIASIPNADTIRFTVSGWPASGTGTLSLTGLNKIELNYTGTTATNVNFNTRRRGYQNTSVAATINTTASGHQAAVNVSSGVASLADQVLTSAGALANRNAWKLNVPEPGIELYLQIRCRNGTTAPASGTTWTIGMLRVEDYIAQTVELTGTRQQSIGNSLPVNITSSATIATTGTTTATLAAATVRAGFVAGAGIWFDDSATNLASNATFTGTSRDLTVTATATAFANAATYAQELRVSAESDVAGTLWLEVSRDNTNWRRVKSVATAAVTGGGQYAEIIHRPSWRYARVGFTNGATAQARFSIGSVLMAV